MIIMIIALSDQNYMFICISCKYQTSVKIIRRSFSLSDFLCTVHFQKLYELYFLSRVQTHRMNYLPRIHQPVSGDTAAFTHTIFARPNGLPPTGLKLSTPFEPGLSKIIRQPVNSNQQPTAIWPKFICQPSLPGLH